MHRLVCTFVVKIFFQSVTKHQNHIFLQKASGSVKMTCQAMTQISLEIYILVRVLLCTQGIVKHASFMRTVKIDQTGHIGRMIYDRVPTEFLKQFPYFSMIFHDQQCNFHDYLMHGLQPTLLAASSPLCA